MSEKGGGAVFPSDFTVPAGTIFPDGNREKRDQRFIQQGMSLRDWFAGQALAGVMAQPNLHGCDPQLISDLAWNMADAMLAARTEEGAGNG